ncbi:MAG: lipoyl(octanoyl) transferase LipB [Polyangiales bacterium]
MSVGRALSHLSVHRLGRVPYAETHELQRRLVEARVEGRIGDVLLLLEHDPPSFTLGRSAKENHVLLPKEFLATQGIEVHDTGRGGDVTYHGPGQLVGYPIVSLSPDRQDVRKYVASLEETMIRVAADYGISASRVEGLNGAWVGDRKIGAVGVRISRWVTMHGFALNVSTNLAHFALIVPCGIRDKDVTSILRETGHDVPMHEIEDAAIRHFAEQYGSEVEVHDGPPTIPD